MKLVVTGDLHLGITSRKILQKHAKQVAETNPDVLVIAGDIGEVINGVNNFSDCLNIYKKLVNTVLVIPGNHDLYCYEDSDHNSLQLWSDILPKITEDCGCFWLENSTHTHDGIAIIGSYLHYDYSVLNTIGVCSHYDAAWYEINKRGIIADGKYHHGLPKDKEFAALMRDSFQSRIRAAQENSSIKQIVVVTHVPVMECLITRLPFDYNWSIATPFFGNTSSEEFIRSCDKVKFVFSAHNHQYKDIPGRIHCYNPGSDYNNPQHIVIEI